jgi:hypothetical protein
VKNTVVSIRPNPSYTFQALIQFLQGVEVVKLGNVPMPLEGPIMVEYATAYRNRYVPNFQPLAIEEI